MKTVLESVVMIGDRILLRPMNPANQSNGGLYLPPSVKEKDDVQTGVVVKVGPGYPIPAETSDTEMFLQDSLKDQVRYIPLQVQEGDQAIYLQKHAYEIDMHGERYLIVPQAAILMVYRDALPFGL